MTSPQFFGYREMPADMGNCTALFREMAEAQSKAGAIYFRYTIVSPEFSNPPCPPYPPGLYVEGWAGKQQWPLPKFDFPLTAAGSVA